jgi:hypothetical protein
MNPLKQVNDANKHWAIDDAPDVLSHIYNDDISIAIWQRSLSENTDAYVQALLQSSQKIALKLVATPHKLQQELQRIFPDIITAKNNTFTHHEFLQNLNELLEMFSCLFDSPTIGLRINTLERSMCPRFHVDNVPVRLVTTYGGAGTQWLPAAYADCSKLGPKARGVMDEHSGIICNAQAIQQLNAGDVALLKGENWEGNEGRGLIHRSPSYNSSDTEQVQRRLLITCDLV